MNKVLIFFISFFVISSSFAQTVKKVKIEELESYIKNSDHPLVVSFWATWCSPCVKEIPWLQEAIAKKQDKNIEFVLVSLDFRDAYPKRIVDLAKEKKFTATQFWLDETNADHYCPKIDVKWEGAIPANLFVNNKTGYRKFFPRQLTNLQVDQEVGWLVAEQNVK